MKLKELSTVFNPIDIEWRLQNCGFKQNGEPWAMVLAYVTNRAIMDRLDEVCEPENWKNEFAEGPGGGVICGISIRCGDEWVTKWDGADKTQIEAVKGGLSGAMKRAGVQWGIGRYLYNLDATFAKCATDKRHYDNQGYDKKTKAAFSWETPQLPKWAVPGGDGKPDKAVEKKKAAPKKAAPKQAPQKEPLSGHDWKDDRQRKLFIGMMASMIPPEEYEAFEKFLMLTMNAAIEAEGREPKKAMSQAFIGHAVKNMTDLINEFQKE